MDGDQTQNFQLALAVGRDHGGLVADFLVEQGAANGRSGRDLARAYVGLFAGHQLVFDFFILGAVVDLDRGTQPHLVLGDVVHVGQGQVGETLAELAEARLDELLTLLGHVIFGVLAEVAESGGALDFFGQLVDQFVLERVDFFLQFFSKLISHACKYSFRRL